MHCCLGLEYQGIKSKSNFGAEGLGEAVQLVEMEKVTRRKRFIATLQSFEENSCNLI
jgi:hypothetical protein